MSQVVEQKIYKERIAACSPAEQDRLKQNGDKWARAPWSSPVDAPVADNYAFSLCLHIRLMLDIGWSTRCYYCHSDVPHP